MSEAVLTIQDCRASGFCVKGVRKKCPEIGVDFKRLIKEGIPVPELEHIEDHHLQAALEKARERHSGEVHR